jgi:S1-C subfamily serine protease
VTERNIVLVKNEKVYTVSKVINDPATKLKFIQVTPLSVPVLEFSARESLSNGQTVLIPDVLENATVLNHIENIAFRPIVKKTDLLESFENYDQRILLSQDLREDFVGAPILSLNGEIVGIFTSGRTAIKINYINALLKSVLKNSKLSKPYIGLSYLSLYNAVGSTSFGDGIQLIRTTSGITVRPDSPFFNTLLEGDIILTVEGQKITSENTFTDIILDYKPGNVLKFKIKRQDKEFEVEKAIGEK